VTEPEKDVADLLDVQSPSAIERQDAALRGAGVAPRDLAGARDALLALAAEGAPAAAAPAPLRDRLLATLGRGGKYGLFADRLARLFDISTDAAAALAKSLEDDSAWKPFIVDGVQMIPVEAGPKCAGSIATMVRLQPGAKFPEHVHHGEETMFVLDGGFCEAGEKARADFEAWRGDEVVRDDGTGHGLVALPGVPCVAAVIIFGYADFG
jgi:putative transcriptional regulator